MVMRTGAGGTDRVRLARGHRALLVLGVVVALVAAGCGDDDVVGVGGEPGDDPVGNDELVGCEVPVPSLEDPGPLELVVDPVDAQPGDAVSVQVVPPEERDRTDVWMGGAVGVDSWQGDGWGEEFWAGIPLDLADDREASQEVVLELTRWDPDHPIDFDDAPRDWDGVVLGVPEDMVEGHYRVTLSAQLLGEPPLDRSRAVFSVGCS